MTETMSPQASDPELAARLARRTAELVDVRSTSREEEEILDVIEDLLRSRSHLVTTRGEGTVLASPGRRPGHPFVLLAGHVDTVPAQGNLPARVRDGWVSGLGAADMKGALAVMIECSGDRPAGEVDLAYLFFGREEVPIAESALRPFLRSAASLGQIDLAIVMEPTANVVQVGCLGNLNAVVTFEGVSAHSARPWLGRNAIHAAVHGLRAIAESEPRDVMVDGLAYREVMSVTTIDGGIANNIVPGSVRCGVNVRYAPGRAGTDAEDELRRLVAGPGVGVEIISDAPPGPVSMGNALVRRLRDAGDLELGPKQAWTPVAEFGEVGVDAVNFGPGDPVFAHRAEESVSIAALVRSCEVVRAFAGRS